MKKYILLALLFITTINSPLWGKECYFSLKKYPFTRTILFTVHVGDSLYITGDKIQLTVGGDELQNAAEEGHSLGIPYWDGTHYVNYKGGIGGKEGIKIIYNSSLWRLDRTSLTSHVTNSEGNLNDQKGKWVFEAVTATPAYQPQELRFYNGVGEVATLKVNIIDSLDEARCF